MSTILLRSVKIIWFNEHVSGCRQLVTRPTRHTIISSHGQLVTKIWLWRVDHVTSWLAPVYHGPMNCIVGLRVITESILTTIYVLCVVLYRWHHAPQNPVPQLWYWWHYFTFNRFLCNSWNVTRYRTAPRIAVHRKTTDLPVSTRHDDAGQSSMHRAVATTTNVRKQLSGSRSNPRKTQRQRSLINRFSCTYHQHIALFIDIRLLNSCQNTPKHIR